MTTKFKDREWIYAIIRHDQFQTDQQFTVKEIVRSLEIAKAEVEKLNKSNGDKGAVHSWQATRLYPAGSAAGPVKLQPPNI